MTNKNRYILERYNGRRSRFLCPNCGHKRHTLTRYVDTQTDNYIADHVGMCARKDHCGYHYPPRSFFADRNGGNFDQSPFIPQSLAENVFDTLPLHYIEDSAKAYGHNHFISFLTKCFDVHIALKMASLYKIGTSRYWPGATIFWQLDVDDKLRTGKIMLYNPTDGHRVKEPYNHVTWVHRLVGSGQSTESSNANGKLPTAEYRLKQCFFGEHLLRSDPFKTVAIAESEKTAVIASFFYPEYIWLAAGSLDGLNHNKCKVLQGRSVILFPDVNGFDKWRLKAREMNLRFFTSNFKVDKSLANTATAEERQRGIDIADRWIEQLASFK